MSRTERTEKTEKNEKTNEKTSIKSKLTIEEDTKRQQLLRSLIYGKKTDSVDFKAPAELIYLIVLSKLENRELVEGDMKELKVALDRIADRIGEIIQKSRTKPPAKRTSVN
jgi:hypothetical protein